MACHGAKVSSLQVVNALVVVVSVQLVLGCKLLPKMQLSCPHTNMAIPREWTRIEDTIVTGIITKLIPPEYSLVTNWSKTTEINSQRISAGNLWFCLFQVPVRKR